MENETTFESLGLSPKMLGTLTQKGYKFPTEIQRKAIPLVLNTEQDMIGQAQTGTGKTGAFGIPIIEKLDLHTKDIQTIILAPTRELAIQVSQELESYRGSNSLGIVLLCGGHPMHKQIQQLKSSSPKHIIVGTPGRVIDHLRNKRMDLKQLKFLVLDEVDEMLKVGFKEEVETILAETNKNKRTFMFTATLPKYIMEIGKNYLKDPEILRVKRDESKAPLVSQQFYVCPPKEKRNLLYRVLDFSTDFYGFVFCKTKRDVDELTRNLLAKNYLADSLHGDMSQQQRELALQKFKRKQCTVLVVTDVASRGIDIKNISHVINYALPQNEEVYTHRIGRTGRAGETGTAITFVQPSEMRQFDRFYIKKNPSLEEKKPPKPSEIIELKKQALFNTILPFKPNAEIKKLAEELLESHPPEQLVSFLLEKSYANSFDVSQYPEINTRETRSYHDKKPYSRDFNRDRKGKGSFHGGKRKPFKKRFD